MSLPNIQLKLKLYVDNLLQRNRSIFRNHFSQIRERSVQIINEQEIRFQLMTPSLSPFLSPACPLPPAPLLSPERRRIITEEEEKMFSILCQERERLLLGFALALPFRLLPRRPPLRGRTGPASGCL